MDTLTPVAVKPTDPRLEPLIRTHLELMWASSPACSVHAMDAESLDAGGASLLAIFDDGEAVALYQPVQFVEQVSRSSAISFNAICENVSYQALIGII